MSIIVQLSPRLNIILHNHSTHVVRGEWGKDFQSDITSEDAAQINQVGAFFSSLGIELLMQLPGTKKHK